MKKWEYTYQELAEDVDMTLLNALGAVGWELVTVTTLRVYFEDHTKQVALLKREFYEPIPLTGALVSKEKAAVA